MTTKGKRYDKDFKLGAVKMVLEKGRSINSVAVDLGVSYDTLHRWIREFKTDPQNSFRGSGHLRPDEEEIRWLKKENQDLREENAILKKATAIFANHRK
jgi:transposase